MPHVMIDLETLATSSDAAVVAIGACEFDIASGKISRKFYQRINWDTAIRGRRVDGDTLKWWMKQDEAALSEILDGTNEVPFVKALKDFSAWIPASAFVWGNGSIFDVSIMAQAYGQNYLPIPWDYRNVYDCRTIQMLADNVDRYTYKLEGTKHNALDDAIWQARYTSAMWRSIKNFDLNT